MMSALDKLKLSEKTRRAVAATPEGRLRHKLVEAINQQIAAAEAMQKGEGFEIRRKRWTKDSEGNKTLQDRLVKFRPWYWQEANGAFMLEVRYGNKIVEIKPKKTAIEIGDVAELVPTLTLVRDAVVAGELDKQLAAMKGRFGKKLA
ncbi:hypothetical protein WV31_15930 [Magnetospirillum sp. ME-1]|uniref:DUF6641 family protein n=1 Tax=Magnetospirillum sp. ME-1 TaxID=1639348 RepID=UPI000A17B020|nr:DUF6641 family protein [Magnetospirillum sp. ME-1]ARJ67051.1 hypothetical protein WV31_15930 [Magnetospirillum sp. ME-1]